MTPAVLELRCIRLVRDGAVVLDGVDWTVREGERWVVLGPNGCGKTTLVRIASMWLHPSSGSVAVAGGELGRVDVRRHRARIAVVSAALADQLRPGIAVLDVVRTAKHAALEAWWHHYDAGDDAAAASALERFGVGHLAARTFGTLSSGERQRVLLARTLMNDPAVVLLDEPSARLDLGGREQLVAALDDLASDPAAPPSVVVTHHVDDIPPTTTHALLLRDGRILRAGAIDDVLDADGLSETFGLALTLERRPSGRFSAWARR